MSPRLPLPPLFPAPLGCFDCSQPGSSIPPYPFLFSSSKSMCYSSNCSAATMAATLGSLGDNPKAAAAAAAFTAAPPCNELTCSAAAATPGILLPASTPASPWLALVTPSAELDSVSPSYSPFGFGRASPDPIPSPPSPSPPTALQFRPPGLGSSPGPGPGPGSIPIPIPIPIPLRILVR